MTSGRHRVCARGFTLVETLVSVVIASFILAAMMSAVLLASQALPQRGAGLDRAVQAAGALDRLLTDLHYAKTVTQRDARSITLTVADRTGDGADETLSYAWSGTAGAPLTYRINGTAATLLEDVREFDLAYAVAAKTRTVTSSTESAETLLMDCNGGLLDYSYPLDATHWATQYVRPALPAEAVSWRITRVFYRSRYHGGTSGVTQVQVRPASSSNQPLNYIIDQSNVPESSLGWSFGWAEADFSAARPLDTTRGACVVWEWGSDTNSADVMYHTLGSSSSRYYLLTSSNGGGSWSGNTSQSACLYVYGTYTTNNAPTSVTDYLLERVRVTLRSGADVSARVRGASVVLNAPQVTGP